VERQSKGADVISGTIARVAVMAKLSGTDKVVVLAARRGRWQLIWPYGAEGNAFRQGQLVKMRANIGRALAASWHELPVHQPYK